MCSNSGLQCRTAQYYRFKIDPQVFCTCSISTNTPVVSASTTVASTRTVTAIEAQTGFKTASGCRRRFNF